MLSIKVLLFEVKLNYGSNVQYDVHSKDGMNHINTRQLQCVHFWHPYICVLRMRFTAMILGEINVFYFLCTISTSNIRKWIKRGINVLIYKALLQCTKNSPRGKNVPCILLTNTRNHFWSWQHVRADHLFPFIGWGLSEVSRVSELANWAFIWNRWTEGLWWQKECRAWHCRIVIPKETLMGFFFSDHQSFSNYLSCLAEIYHNRHLGNWWHPPLGFGLLFDLCRRGNLGL